MDAPQSLSTIIETCRPEDRRTLALEILAHCRARGRHGVLAVNNLMKATPPAAKPAMLSTIWHASVSDAAWATGLVLAFVGGSDAVMAAAGSRELLAEWFRRANLMAPYPFLRGILYSATDLAPRVKLYRGGSDARAFLRDGLSWTPFRGVAALYAEKRRSEHGGKAVVMAAQVDRDRLVMATRTAESEFVLLTAPRAWVDTADPRVITNLARKQFPKCTAGHENSRLVLSVDGEAGWHGWTGAGD